MSIMMSQTSPIVITSESPYIQSITSPLPYLQSWTSNISPVSPTSPTGPYPVSVTSPYLPLSPYSTYSPIMPLNDYFSLEPLGNYPQIALVHETVNNDPRTQQLMIKHFYYKVLDKWLLDGMSDILNYFIYKDGKVDLIKNLHDYKPSNINNDTDEVAQKKVDYIQQHIFSKYDMTNILVKFIKGSHTLWVNLPKNEYQLRPFIKEYLLKNIKSKIKA